MKDIIDLYNIISENIFYDEKEKNYLFKQIMNCISKNGINIKIIKLQFQKKLIIIIIHILNN